MKKVFVISLLMIMAFCSYSEARVKYDSTGRNIIYDDTIRGRKRMVQEPELQKRRLQAAAAAKMNYESVLRSYDIQEDDNKTNSIE